MASTPSGPAGGDLAGTYPDPTLAVIGAATGPEGDATHTAVVTIDTKGRVTALSETPILFPSGAVELNGAYSAFASCVFLGGSVAGGDLSMQPRVVAAAGNVIDGLSSEVANLAGFTPTLDWLVRVWVSNAAGTQSILGHFAGGDSNHALIAATKGGVTIDAAVGADLTVPGAAGDPFTVASTAGGVFFAGASVEITID